MILALLLLSTGVFADLRYNYEEIRTGCIYPYWEVNGRFSLESCAEECQEAKPTMCTLFSYERPSGRCFLTQGGQIGSGCSDETVYKLVAREYDTSDDRRCGCPPGWKEYEQSCKGCRSNLFCRMMDPKLPWKSKYYCNLGRGVPAGWNTNENRAKGIHKNCCDVGGSPLAEAEAAVGGHTVDYTLLKTGAECMSSDSLVGSDLSLEQCAKQAGDRGSARHGWAQYFIYGTGSKSGWCYVEYTKGDWCPEGWEKDDYDFYKLTHKWTAEEAVGRSMGSLERPKQAAMTKDETAVGRMGYGRCWIKKDGKMYQPKTKHVGHGCLKGSYTSHGVLEGSCECAKKCLASGCKMFAMLDNKCWTSDEMEPEYGYCSNSNILYQYEEMIYTMDGLVNYCECKSGNSCNGGKCVVDIDSSCSDKKWSWSDLAKVSSIPCGGAATVAVAENVAPGPSNVILAFALVGFIVTIYGAGRHYFKN